MTSQTELLTGARRASRGRGPVTVAPDRPRGSAAFRPDIEGLRAVAIGLVLLYHAGMRFVPGGFVGVDVFFVISGFLITGVLVREVERTGRVSLRRFYARRAKRLLPAAAVVLVVTAVLVWVLLPVTQRRVLGGDIVSAALYVVNWRLAGRSVDYLAEGIDVSPVQHFWSLAVEEQFYLLWPLLLVAVALVLRHRRRGRRMPGRAVMAAGLGLVAVPSFVCSVVWTASSPSVAFFVTPTRLWEMAVGAGVSLGAALWVRLPRGAAAATMGAGLVAVVVAALVLDGSAPWPGSSALLPVLGTAAVIVGGARAGGSPVGRALASRPSVWVGGLSYSLYLWHWPLLVAAQARWGELRVRQAVGVLAVSVVLAWLSHRYVENPVRFSERLSRSPRRALGLGAALTAVGVLAGAVVVLPSALAVPGGGGAPGAARAALGAQALLDPSYPDPSSVDHVDRITPAPDRATLDVPAIYEDGCQVLGELATTCVYGDRDSTVTVVLVGDSKAGQWESVLDRIASRRGWRLVTVLKSACAFSDATLRGSDGGPFTGCDRWNAAALDQVRAARPSLVLTSQGAFEALDDGGADGSSAVSAEPLVEGLVSRWTTLADEGVPVVAIAGNAEPPQEIYECVAEHTDSLSSCTFRPRWKVARVQREAVRDVPGARLLDLGDLVCPHDSCPAVIGGVLVYRQGSHLTRTFVDSTEPELERRLDPLLPAAMRGTRR